MAFSTYFVLFEDLFQLQRVKWSILLVLKHKLTERYIHIRKNLFDNSKIDHLTLRIFSMHFTTSFNRPHSLDYTEMGG
jgi:hypothetical protein